MWEVWDTGDDWIIVKAGHKVAEGCRHCATLCTFEDAEDWISRVKLLWKAFQHERWKRAKLARRFRNFDTDNE